MVSDDRAQLLLVGSVLVALAIVASVVLLNSIYAPQNLRTGSVETDSEDLYGTQQALLDDLREYFHRVEANTTRKPAAIPYAPSTDSPLANDTHNVSTLYGSLLSATSSGSISVSVTGRTVGDVVAQQSTGEFTNYSTVPANETGNWTLFTGVQRVPRFHATITSLGSETASVETTGTGGTWRLDVSEDAVATSGPNGSTVLCDPGPAITSARVDVLAGSGSVVVEAGGDTHQCGSFRFASGVTNHDITVERGDAIRGTYYVTADGSANTTNTGAPSSSGQQPWSVSDVVVNVDFEMTYVSGGVTYESRFPLYGEIGS
jgi:hypothetical protein